jgi:hypothetical protein
MSLLPVEFMAKHKAACCSLMREVIEALEGRALQGQEIVN